MKSNYQQQMEVAKYNFECALGGVQECIGDSKEAQDSCIQLAKNREDEVPQPLLIYLLRVSFRGSRKFTNSQPTDDGRARKGEAPYRYNAKSNGVSNGKSSLKSFIKVGHQHLGEEKTHQGYLSRSSGNTGLDQ